jgi:hypothetical protein
VLVILIRQELTLLMRTRNIVSPCVSGSRYPFVQAFVAKLCLFNLAQSRVESGFQFAVAHGHVCTSNLGRSVSNQTSDEIENGRVCHKRHAE